MFTQFLRKSLFSKIMATAVSIGFVLTSVPVSYARTDSLRPQAAKKNPGIMYDFEHAAMRRFLERVNARDKKYTVRTIEDVDGDIRIQAVPGMAEEMFKETGRHFRGHYAIRPDKNGITYIYIDKDTFYGKNGEDYVQHEMDELIAIRVFAKDKGWTFDELVEWLDETGHPDEVAELLAGIHDDARELPEGALEIVGDLTPTTDIFRRAVRSAAASGQTLPMDLVTMTMDELKPQIQQKGISSGFIALDWNVGKVDKTEDLERINKSVPTITKIFHEMGIQYLYGFTHRGRPKGTGFEDDAKLKLRPVIDKARDFLQGLSIEIVPLSYDLEKAAQEIAEAKVKYQGRKIFFIFENIRFYPEEQAKDAKVREEFEKKLIALTGQSAEQLVYFSEAFDKAHRGKEASMELVKWIPKQSRAAGIALEQDLNAVIGFLQGISGKVTVLFGGAKFDKFANIATISEGIMKQKQGILLIAGAQANAWEKLANEKEVGKSLLPKDEEIGEVRAAVEAIKSSGVQVLAPFDYRVKVEDEALAEPQKVLTKDMSQVDVGPETIAFFRQQFWALKAGDGLILNGGTGMFDKGFPEGTFALIEEAEAAADRGVSVLFAGGDMDQAARAYERAKNKKLNPKIKRTTGGGVVWTIIAKNIVENPKEMPAIEAVLKPAVPVVLKTALQLPTPGVGFPGVGPAALEPVFPNKIPLGDKLTVGGNWKLRKDITTEAEARAKAREFRAQFADVDPNAEAVLFIQDKWMKVISEELQGSVIKVGVQSFHFDPEGNIEEQIEDAVNNGAKYAMVGHSMHRYPNEKQFPPGGETKMPEPLSNEGANQIAKAILQDGRLKLWYVIGLNDSPGSIAPQEDQIKQWIFDAINIGLDGVREDQISNIIITAEPMSAISTAAGDGKIDPNTFVDFERVEMLTKYSTEALNNKFGSAAEKVNIGYGATASPLTATRLLAHPRVFNILPGGKSLEANDFYGTVVNAIIGKYGSHGADVEIAQKLNVGVSKVRRAISLNKAAYTATAGEEAFSDYTTSVASNLGEQRLALIVTPECFRMGGMNNTLKEIEKLGSVLKIALYGEKADKLKIWVGNKDIVTAKSLDELLAKLAEMGIAPANTLLLSAKAEEIDATKLEQKKIRHIVAPDIATLAVAKAVKELIGTDNVQRDFIEFLTRIIDDEVIESISRENRIDIIKKLEEGTFAFPEEVKMTEKVAKETEEATLVTSEVLDI